MFSGLASLVITITDQNELPTSISGTITWTEQKVTKFNWEDYTAPGITGVVSKTFTHTYSIPLNYTITVEMFNLISSITEMIEVSYIFKPTKIYEFGKVRKINIVKLYFFF